MRHERVGAVPHPFLFIVELYCSCLKNSPELADNDARGMSHGLF